MKRDGGQRQLECKESKMFVIVVCGQGDEDGGNSRLVKKSYNLSPPFHVLSGILD